MDALSWGQIFGRMAWQFWPVWAALILTFAVSVRFKRRLGLYGKLYDSPVGMIGFGLVMFWVFTALFSAVIMTHDPLTQVSGMKNALPGFPQKGAEGAYYLLGGDNLARAVFSRMVGDKSIGIGFIATGLAYNKDIFKRNGWAAPTSWNDLTDPKFKGKVVIPPITNGYGLLTLVMQARVNGGGEDRIDPGFDVMAKRVAPNVLAWEPSPGKMAQMMQTGEAALVVWGNGRVQSVADQGAPVEFVYPREGAPVIMVAGCAVEGGPQPKLGQQFLQHVISAEVQAMLATHVGFGPVNRNTKLPPEVIKKVVYGPQQVSALVAPNYTIINAKRAEWTQRWNRAIEK